MTPFKNTRLKDLCVARISNGAFNDPQKVGSGYRLINVKDLYTEPTIDEEKLCLLELTEKEFKRHSVKTGDLFFTRSSLKAEGIAHCNIYKGESDDIVYECHIMRARVDQQTVTPLFLFHYCKSYQARKYFIRHSKVATMTTIDQSDLGRLPIALPPLPEQKAIADLLSTWDEAIEKTERLIQAKEASLKGQIQRIMGKKAIDANGWSMVHLGELFSEVTRKVGEKELTPYSISAGIGFVSQREKWGKDISGSQHKNYTHLKAGEFSYNKGNSKRYQQGCVYLLKKGEICVPNVFISFKPKAKNVVPEFFEHYFIANYHARELKRYITSGARSDGLLNLNKKDFFKIMVPCPSPEEQKAIAEVLTASQQEIDLLKQLADKYKTQKRGLMQKMLTGEWRVRGFATNDEG